VYLREKPQTCWAGENEPSATEIFGGRRALALAALLIFGPFLIGSYMVSNIPQKISNAKQKRELQRRRLLEEIEAQARRVEREQQERVEKLQAEQVVKAKQAEQEHQRQLREMYAEQRDLERLKTMEPSQFENLVAAVFAFYGYEPKLTSGGADGGVDIYLFKGGEKHVAQCKRYRSQVGAPEIRDFFGTLVHEKAIRGFFITTSHFSLQARSFANGKPIELVDGHKLMKMLTESTQKPEIGQSQEPVVEQCSNHITRGWANFRSGSLWEAVTEFFSAISRNESVNEAYYGRACSLYQLGYYPNALSDLMKVEKLEKDYEYYFEDVFTLRGRIRMIMRDFENAIADFDKALERDPMLSEVYALRGFAKKELGMKDSADLDLARAKALGFQIST
jgi:tetratricopeptide (TPR) repeat protein